VESLYDNYLGRDEYDVRELTPDPFPYGFYGDYLNTPLVQAAIGAFQNFSTSSESVYEAFTATGDDNRESGTIEALQKLIKQNITVMLYAGDADYKFVFLESPLLEFMLIMLIAVIGWVARSSPMKLKLQDLIVPDIQIFRPRTQWSMDKSNNPRNSPLFGFTKV